MTAIELTRIYLDDSGFQTTKVFEGITEDQADIKVCESSMSARETLIHLTDCVFAAQLAVVDGGDYEWGSYRPDDCSMPSLMATFQAERDKAVRAVIEKGDDEKSLKAAQAYLAGHEYYHVGQMASLRLKVTPDWDAYSIYR